MKPNRSRRDPTSTAAAATRRWRERKAGGRRVVSVEVLEHEIQELVRLGYLRSKVCYPSPTLTTGLPWRPLSRA